MSSLEALQHAPKRVSHRRFKKTQKRLNIVSAEMLDIISSRHCLSKWQKELIRKVDIENQNFSHIARCCACTKQYVSQEYTRIYNKVMGIT